MKFNKKLIELRKQKGLSQEELGYKLNVTRQTVSKWELGQTTPEMDKLVELSRLFGITVDDLTKDEPMNNEVGKIKDEPINESEGKGSSIKVILLVVLIFIIGGTLVFGFIFKSFFNNNGILGIIDNIFNKFNDTASQMQNNLEQRTDKMQNDFEQKVDKMQNDFEQKAGQMKNDSERKSLTVILESYAGTEYGSSIGNAIDKVITNNKKYKDSMVTVTYQDQNTTDSTELRNIKSKLDKWTEYEVSYEYDENGYIYQMDIFNI